MPPIHQSPGLLTKDLTQVVNRYRVRALEVIMKAITGLTRRSPFIYCGHFSLVYFVDCLCKSFNFSYLSDLFTWLLVSRSFMNCSFF